MKLALETYLKGATRGLPRRARAEAQAELRSHVYERAQDLQLAGTPPDDAVQQAVQELGDARTVARSLQRAHHVHPALSALVLAVLVAGTAWPASLGFADFRKAQLDRLGERVTLVTENPLEFRKFGLLGWDEYRSFLSALGIQVSGRGLNAQLHSAGQPSVPVAEPAGHSHILLYERSSNWRLGADFYDANATADALVRAGWPVRVELNSQLNSGQPSLSLNGHRVVAGQWSSYGTEMTVLNAVGRALDTIDLPHNVRAPEAEAFELYPSRGYSKQFNVPYTAMSMRPAYTLPTAGTVGHLYVLAVRDTSIDYSQIEESSARQAAHLEPIIRLLIAPTGPGGNLNFGLWKLVKPVPRLRLYPNTQAWAQAPVPLEPSAAERPAMLIEVQPDLSALAHGLTVLARGGHLTPLTGP